MTNGPELQAVSESRELPPRPAVLSISKPLEACEQETDKGEVISSGTESEYGLLGGMEGMEKDYLEV